MNENAPKLQWFARSDTGRARANNQDFAYAGAVPGAEAWHVFVVADGVGGHAAGEWASARAVEAFVRDLGSAIETLPPAVALERAVQAANRAVITEADGSGAATTLVAALCLGDQAWWVNVGDSRLYRSFEGRWTQVSVDHSWVQEQYTLGNLTPEQAASHPRRNVILRTVGFESEVRPDSGGPFSLMPGDRLLLCSDGLHGAVAEPELRASALGVAPDSATLRLIELANAAGGPDNITAIVVELVPRDPDPGGAELNKTIEAPKPTKRRRGWRRLPFMRAATAMAVVALAVGTGYLS